jgi:hypothetical protein
MVSVDAGARPESAKAVFERICENEFQFFEGIDAVAVRVELAKFGVAEIPFESRPAQLKRVNVGLQAEADEILQIFEEQPRLVFRAERAETRVEILEAKVARLEGLLTAEQRAAARAEDDETENRTLQANVARLKELAPAEKLLELRATKGEAAAELELGEKLLEKEPERAKTLLRKCGLSRAAELLACPSSWPEFPSDSMAAPYARQLKEWLPWAGSASLLAKGEGRPTLLVARIVGKSKTLVVVQTQNGKSICGGYVAPAWCNRVWCASDPSNSSFLFTLQNHLGKPTTKFPINPGATKVFYMTDNRFILGDLSNGSGNTYTTSTLGHGGQFGALQEPLALGTCVLAGEGSGSQKVSVARWEFWQLA